MEYYSIIDLLYGPVVFFLLVFYANLKRKRNIHESPEYKYYTWGLYSKLFGGIALCMIYSFYYTGGDTINYYHDGLCMMNLLYQDFPSWFAVMKETASLQNLFYFSPSTGYPVYLRDPNTFFVVKTICLFVVISGGSYIVATLLVTFVSFLGVWKLYEVFVNEFPELRKEMAIAVLFIPSVFFWGSGILKDTITFSAIGFYTFSFYRIFIKRDKLLKNSITLFVSIYLLLAIKPYIILALLPGSLVWVVQKYISGMSNKIIKTLTGPLLFVIAIAGGYALLYSMNDMLGQYSLDNVLEKAVVTAEDLKASYYMGNSFDIGQFDATIPSMLSKAPAAIAAGLFRPYLWEVNNIVMLLSGLEGILILLFTLKILWQMRIVGIFTYFAKNHLLVFSLIFSLFFAFSVGISTSNFGSLVRYRIPVLPFYVGSLFIFEFYRKRDLNSSASFLGRKDEVYIIKDSEKKAQSIDT